ncbi:hypothetical protein OIU92_00145 [Escherichia coli]|nr:hypothetical protein [Escherichia coli]
MKSPMYRVNQYGDADVSHLDVQSPATLGRIRYASSKPLLEPLSAPQAGGSMTCWTRWMRGSR